MDNLHPTKHPLLIDNGLHLQAVFNLSDIPDEITAVISEHVPDLSRFKQLIMFGHGGTRMWESVQQSEFAGDDHPIDSFSVNIVKQYFADTCSGSSFEILYPHSSRMVPLQKLGVLAGWHNASPFRIGINAEWGSWFAYARWCWQIRNLRLRLKWMPLRHVTVVRRSRASRPARPMRSVEMTARLNHASITD